MGIRKEIREGKDMKESEQIYANLNMKKTGENIRSRRERLGMNRPDIQKKMGSPGFRVSGTGRREKRCRALKICLHLPRSYIRR